VNLLTFQTAHAKSNPNPKKMVWRRVPLPARYHTLAQDHPFLGRDWNIELGKRIALARDAKDNDKWAGLANELALHNLRLIFTVVNSSKIQNLASLFGISEGDLLGAGFVGLLEAARGYDPAIGDFSPYAIKSITSEIFEFIGNSKPLDANRSAVSRLKILEAAFADIDSISGEITAEDIEALSRGNGRVKKMLGTALSKEGGADRLREKVTRRRDAVDSTRKIVFLDDTSESGTAANLVGERDPESAILGGCQLDQILSQLDGIGIILNDKQRYVLEQRILGGCKQKAVGDDLHISKERVRQIELQVLKIISGSLGVRDCVTRSVSERKNSILDAKIRFLEQSGVPIGVYSHWNLSALPLSLLERAIPCAISHGRLESLPFSSDYGTAKRFVKELARMHPNDFEKETGGIASSA
jgi:RNA polymerase sigma factor (sigma-70 family)